jgi:mRNA interferase RelE/StbE
VETPRAYVRLTEPAFGDLERLLAVDPQIVRWALKKMLLLERDPGAGRPLLGDLIGWRKLVVGDRDWRIVWRVTTDEHANTVIEIAEVWAVGARADAEVYAEMNYRIAALGDNPTTQALSSVIAQLGRAGGGITASDEPTADPVPPWLVDRLVHQLHMTPDEVARLTGAEAMQRWETFITTGS